MRFKIILAMFLAVIMVTPCASASLRFDNEYETKQVEIDAQNGGNGTVAVNILDYNNVNNWNSTIRPLQEENESFRGISQYSFVFPQIVKLNRSSGSPGAWGENYTFSFPYTPSPDLVFDGHSDAWLRLPVNNISLGPSGTHEIRLAIFKPYVEAYNISLNESIDNVTLVSGEHGDTPNVKIYDDIVYTNRNSIYGRSIPPGILNYTYQDNRLVEWNTTQNDIITPQNITYNFTYIRVTTPLYRNTQYVFVVQMTTIAPTNPEYQMLFTTGDYNNDLVFRSELFYNNTQKNVSVDLDTPMIMTDLVSGPTYSTGFKEYATNTTYMFQYYIQDDVTSADNISIQMPVYALDSGNFSVAVGLANATYGDPSILDPQSIFLEGFQSFEGTFPPPSWSLNGVEWVKELDGTAPDGSYVAHLHGPYGAGPERLITTTFDTTSVDSIQIEFSYYVTSQADPDDFRLFAINETGVAIEWADFDGFIPDSWEQFSTTITDTQYFHNGFQIYWEGGGSVVALEELSIDALYFNVTSGENTFKTLSPGYNMVTFTNLINFSMDVRRVDILINVSNGFNSDIGFFLGQTEGIEGRTLIKDRNSPFTYFYRTNAPSLCRIVISEGAIEHIPLEQYIIYIVPDPSNYTGSLEFVEFAEREWHLIQQAMITTEDDEGIAQNVIITLSIVGLIVVGIAIFLSGGTILPLALAGTIAISWLLRDEIERGINNIKGVFNSIWDGLGILVSEIADFIWGIIEFVVNVISWLITYGVHFFAIYLVICVYLMATYTANGICTAIVRGIKSENSKSKLISRTDIGALRIDVRKRSTIDFKVFDEIIGNTWDFFVKVLSLNMAIGGFLFSLLLVILKAVTGV